MKNIKLTKDEIKSKNIVLLITSICVLIIGGAFFFYNFIPFMDSILTFYIVMLLYFGMEFINYLLTKNQTGMHYLYISLISLLASVSGIIYYNYPSNDLITITLICWFIMMVIIKLIRIFTLRNERNYSVFINLFSMSMFILLGIFTVTNIFMSISNESMMIGFFFTVHGILDLIETLGNIKFCK